MLTINSAFDAGNILVKGIEGFNAELAIRDDIFTELEQKCHKQWFYFRASGCKDTKCVYSIVNAGECSYTAAWNDYNVCATYDRKFWFRVPTSYNKETGVLRWEMTAKRDQIYFAFFGAYSHQQHLDLIAKCSCSDLCSVRAIGETIDKRPLDLVQVGTGPKKIWCAAMQHPGETQGGWWMEGFLSRLLDPHDALARQLRADATFYVVPCMNPDGAFRGHLRTNACGANLNREWTSTGEYTAPTLERSPEVYHGKLYPPHVHCTS